MDVRASRVLIALCVAAGAVVGACREQEPPPPKKAVAARPVVRDTAPPKADSAGGEVRLDSVVAPPEVWVTDANVLALLNTIAGRQIAADNVELQTWHTDTIRAFAASMAREHSAILHSVDSVATRIKLAPVAPALARDVFVAMQARTDTMSWQRGIALDRAYVRHQVASNDAAAKLASQLAAVAERPEVEALATSVVERSKSASAKAKALDTQLTKTDSVKADSIAKAQERRKRSKQP